MAELTVWLLPDSST